MTTQLLTSERLELFLRQSNHIEGIQGLGPNGMRVFSYVEEFLQKEGFLVDDVVKMVDLMGRYQLRDMPGMDVTVYKYKPMKGGSGVRGHLQYVISSMQGFGPWDSSAYSLHREYEILHPFMDGNGRSGRILWLWQKLHRETEDTRTLKIPFLQHWYYESLAHV